MNCFVCHFFYGFNFPPPLLPFLFVKVSSPSHCAAKYVYDIHFFFFHNFFLDLVDSLLEEREGVPCLLTVQLVARLYQPTGVCIRRDGRGLLKESIFVLR